MSYVRQCHRWSVLSVCLCAALVFGVTQRAEGAPDDCCTCLCGSGSQVAVSFTVDSEVNCELVCNFGAWCVTVCGEPYIGYQYGGTAAGAGVCGEDCDGPTIVELMDMLVERGAAGAKLLWETASELDTIGFNIWRSYREEGEYTPINDSPVPSEGGPVQGAVYEYIDNGCPTDACCYKLEDIDTSGVRTFRGPVCL